MREGICAPLLMLCLFDFGLYPVLAKYQNIR